MAHARLTTEQADAMRRRVGPMLKFLGDCRRRLDDRRFDSQSKFYQAVVKAYESIHALHMKAHYESVGVRGEITR